MADSPRFRFYLPHWGWFLLVTVALVIAALGLSIWLPYSREQQVIQKIKSWGGYAYTETGGPEWLRKLVGEVWMRKFKLFDRITRVRLSATVVTDASFARLGNLPNLEYIRLDDTTITDAGLAHLTGRALINLQHLILEGTLVTDAGLAHLSGCPKLEYLFLDRTAVTDAGLIHLTRLTNLRDIWLEDTAVTHKGIAELQNALPDCKIYH